MRHFLDWIRPLPELAAPRLLDSGYRYADTASVDLSRILVLLPGHGASKALTREMTALTAEISAGIFPPVYMTPEEFLLAGTPSSMHPASELEQLSAWKSVLSECDHSRFQTLFSVDFPRESDSVFLYLAKQFNQLKRELSAGGFTIADIRDRAVSDPLFSASPDRWEELAELEKLYSDKLASLGLCDPEYLKIQLSADTGFFSQFDRLIAIGMPDLSELAVRRITAASKSIRTEIWINAPEYLHSFFDDWGRPIPEKWRNYPLSFGNGDDEVNRIFHAGTFEQTAVLAAGMLMESGPDLNGCAVAITDEQFFNPLRKAFSRLKVKDSGKELGVVLPSGEPMKKLRLFDLLNRFSRFVSSDVFDDAVLFLRHSDVLDWISNKISMKPDDILTNLDCFRSAHLPDTLQSAFRLASPVEIPILEHLIECRKMWFVMSPVEAVRDLFSQLYNGRPQTESSGIPLEKELETVKPYLRILESSPLFAGETIDTVIEELLAVCGDIRLYRESQENEFSISGFLELPWSDAKRIILIGMNEGLIPENVSGTTFLSDSMRMKLGLQCNARRKGRDTFYLESLLKSRGAGNMRFLAATVDPDGKPLKFSSLLFQCTDADLLDRASILFDPAHFPEKKKSQIDRRFILTPDFSVVPDFENTVVSVTRFEDYLKSPFCFFLRVFMNMNQQEYDLPEMDQSTFGTICHEILEKTVRCADPEGMKRRILESLEQQKIQRYGSPVPVLPAIQMEQMKQRLLHAAQYLAESASDFTVLKTEYVLGGKKGYVEFEGGRINGRIDCLEYSKSQNLLRLIDFKTGKEETPEKKHYSRKYGFVNLQLPLYRLLIECDPAFRIMFPEIDLSKVRILCGYFNLPQNVTETGYYIWQDMDKHLPAVRSLVRTIFQEIKEMRNGVFYENEEKINKYGEFKFCCQPSLSEAVPSIKLQSRRPDHE